MIRLVREVLLQILYPDCCPFCDRLKKGSDFICEKCRTEIVEIKSPFCHKCGKVLLDEKQELCSDCQSKKRIYFEAGRSLWVHKSPVSDAVYRLKYNDCRSYARIFAWELWRKYEWELRRWEIDVIIPVPIHEERRRKRGYNQAELLAAALSDFSGVRTDFHCIVRKRNTDALKILSLTQRKQNLSGAFQVAKMVKKYQNVLIIDDIYTTGNTINEMAAVLKQFGVKKVYFMTISIGQDF